MKSKKNLFTAVLCVVMATVTAVTSLQVAATAVAQAVEPELSPYIIEFSDSDAAEEFEINANEDFQAQSLDETIVSAQLTENYAQKLENSEEVCLVEEDIVVCANEDETEDETQEIAESVTWSTKALCAQDLPETGEGVKVAVLDSGLDVYSEVTAYHYVDLVDPEYCGGDDLTGHGTAVAGVISAPKDDSGLVGIAPDAELYVVRILDDSNKAPISRVISGIDWCIANEVDIINMSFGTLNYSQILEAKISEAAQAGILMIAAAGNKGAVEYPAKFTEVAAVGAVTSAMTKAGFSATGEELEFVAPGVNVFSTSLIGGYCALSGTSLSAPHIAGAAAVLLGKDTTKSADFIRALLAASCKNLGPASSYGNGIPDLAYALQIYDEFALNYTDSSYQPPVNTGTPETFEDEDSYVVGEWSKEGHDGLADNYYNSEDSVVSNTRFPLIIKAVSKAVDTDQYKCSVIHGSGNYIVTAKILFEIATKYKVGTKNFNYSDYRKQDFLTLVNQEFKTDQYQLLMNDIALALAEHEYNNLSMKKYYSQGAKDFVSVAEKTSTIVFGIFFHLIGDIYAHRAIVPPSAVKVTDRGNYGGTAQTNGNEGLYFVKRDFTMACDSYIADVSDQINTYYKKQMNVFVNKYNNSRSSEKLYYLFKIIEWFFTGRDKAKKNAQYDKKRIQNDIDQNLLLCAQNVPTKAQGGFACATNHSSLNGYPCYAAMIRLCGLGVLQFKDIKYFLKDFYLSKKSKSSLTENEKVLLEEYKKCQKYYEDQAITNAFYHRRYMVSEVVTKKYFSDFYASTAETDCKIFLPYFLLSDYYGEDISKYCVKIDKYYNYLMAFDPTSNVLKKSFWANRNHELFEFTTIIYNGNYFIDPNMYPEEYGKPEYYSKSVFPTQQRTAKDFYLK